MFKTIKAKDKLSARVAKELEKSILNKRFVPDQPIPSEARLCESFGVSRTVVREAIQQLKSQGIIHSIPGSGNYITRNNTSNLQRSMALLASLNEGTPLYLEILQLRQLLEIDCIKSACAAADNKFISELESFVSTMRNNFDSPETVVKADHAFHLTIIKASGNHLFYTILESLYDSFVKIGMKVYDSRESLQAICDEHAAITEAIKNGQTQEACDLLIQHIDQSRRNLT